MNKYTKRYLDRSCGIQSELGGKLVGDQNDGARHEQND
jgi:hypothetical protein